MTTDDEHLAEVLAILRERLEAGDKSALLTAVHECFLLRKPPPEWLRAAFVAAYQSATGFEISSWDDAFGRPHAKSTQLTKQRRDVELRIEVVAQVHELRAGGMPIDEGMFEVIARKLAVKPSKVRELYYDERGKFLREVFNSFDEARASVTNSKKS